MSKSEHSTFLNYLHTTTFEKSCTNQNDDTNTQNDNDELYKPCFHDFNFSNLIKQLEEMIKHVYFDIEKMQKS